MWIFWIRFFFRNIKNVTLSHFQAAQTQDLATARPGDLPHRSSCFVPLTLSTFTCSGLLLFAAFAIMRCPFPDTDYSSSSVRNLRVDGLKPPTCSGAAAAAALLLWRPPPPTRPCRNPCELSPFVRGETSTASPSQQPVVLLPNPSRRFPSG